MLVKGATGAEARTGSLPWQLMPWLLALPGHHQSYNQHVWQSGPCFQQRKISAAGTISIPWKLKKCKYISMFPQKNSTIKQLITHKKWLQLHNRIQVTNDMGHSASGYCSWHGNSTFDTTTEACQPQMGHWKGVQGSRVDGEGLSCSKDSPVRDGLPSTTRWLPS